MPTSYPGAIDAFVNPTSADTLSNPPHDGQHANINDAVEAIETELGINPRGALATVRARLDRLDPVVGHVELSANSSLIAFTDIPQDRRHLRLVAYLRGTTGSTATPCFMQFNGDTTGKYDLQTVRGTGSTASAAHTSSDTGGRFAVPGAGAHTTLFAPVLVDIPAYRGTGWRHFIINYGWGSSAVVGSSSGDLKMENVYGHWRGTAAITSIQLVCSAGNWQAGSIATLHGT